MNTTIKTVVNGSISIVASLFVMATFSSCDKDDAGDTTKPIINLISPAEGEEIEAGADSGLHFEMSLVDDVALGSYKVEIHNNFDGHVHASVKSEDAYDADDYANAFSYLNTWDDIKGLVNADIHHHEIVIPETATHGSYHFIVYCTDAAGNQSSVVRNITIGDEGEDHDH